MKQCPNCKTNYTDDSLSFCLSDGASLIKISDPAETVQMSFDRNPVHAGVAPDSVPTYVSSKSAPPDSVPTFFSPPIAAPPQAQSVQKGVSPIIVGVLVLLLLFLIGGFSAFVFLRPNGKNQVAAVSPTPTASKTNLLNDETTKLKEEMANLQKQLDDQKNQKPTPEQQQQQSSQKPTMTGETFTPPKQTGTTARVNSPGDGFLALRSQPSAEAGYRILKIPHGAAVSVISCQDYSKTSTRAGRWCQVNYAGNFGWAFDAYLNY
jgi:hypothetical protein